MRVKMLLLGIGSLTALCCLCGWLASESRADKSAATADAPARTQFVAQRPVQPAPREDPGITKHRLVAERRLADFISQVRRYEDFDALSKGLDDPVETDQDIVFLAMDETSGHPCLGMQMLSVLADRRVSRMYQMLAAMPADVAARRASECFDERLAELESMWADWIQFAKENDKEKMVQTYKRGTYHAVCCSLFLCSQFCDPGVVIDQADAWKESMEALSEVVIEEELNFDIPFEWMDTIPQPLFVLNVYLCALQRNEPMTTREIKGLVSLDAWRLKEKLLVDWNFPKYSGVADRENTLKGLAIVDAWSWVPDSEKSLALNSAKRELASRSAFAE